MERGSRAAKVQQWIDCLERYEKSGMAVAEFCQKESVSVSAFYSWKKRLAGELSSKQTKPAARQQSESASTRYSFQAVELLPANVSTTTIRFPNGIEIEMGSDLRVADLLIKRLLENVEGGS